MRKAKDIITTYSSYSSGTPCYLKKQDARVSFFSSCMKLCFVWVSVPLLLFNSCIEPFDIQSIAYENLLVVEGFISTEPQSYKIKLSRTYPLDMTLDYPELSASVWIEDGEGTVVNLEEKNPGEYFTPEDFHGIIGMDYQLFITTHTGSQYASEKVNLKSTPDINAIYGAYITRPPDNRGVVSAGIQIYLDTHDPNNATRFYRWEWEDTYEINTPYVSWLKYVNGDFLPQTDTYTRCWQHGVSKNVIIKNSLSLSEDRITKFPIRFIDESSQAMRSKYSILVKQYSLSEEAYTFWNRLKETNESQGTLFDSQPGPVVGNMHSITNKDEMVLGFFHASEVKTKRAFFRPLDFEDFKAPKYFLDCQVDTLPKIEMGFVMTIHEFMKNSGHTHNILYRGLTSTGGELHFVAPKRCTDCSIFADPRKPEFWID